MITKAIVEEVLDRFTIRVRIPSIDRTYQSNIRVNTEDLDVAVVCTLPGCDPNIKPGDVVIVSSEDAEEDPIILGYLYRSKQTDTYIDLMMSRLNVLDEAALPHNTTVGDVSAFEIQQLSGVTSNLQFQIDQLRAEIQLLTEHLNTNGGTS